jgi:multiple sugar transport system substrate-binding protein
MVTKNIKKAIMLILSVMIFISISTFSYAEVDWTKYSGTEITVMCWTRPELEAARLLIPEFEAKTGIKVNWIVMDAWELRAKIAREYALGQPTMDGWFYHPSQQELAIQVGNFQVDQMEYINNPELTPEDWDFDDFLPVGKEGNTVFSKNGGYSLSFTSQPTGLWYRKDLLEENGLLVPKTFEEAEVAAKKLTIDSDGDEKIDLYGWIGRGQGFQTITRIGGFLFGYGGAWWTHDRKSAIDKPETLRGINEYARMLTTYGPPSPLELGWLEVAKLFADGKAAMMPESGEHAFMFEDPTKSSVQGKIGMAPYPSGPAGIAIPTELLSYGIPRDAKNKEASWLFAQWLANKENMKKMLIGGGAVVRASSWDDPEIVPVNKEWADYVKYSLQFGSDYFVNLACVPLTEVREIWGEVVDYAMSGEADLENFAKTKAEEINAIMARDEAGLDIYMDPRFSYMPYDVYRSR